MRSKTSLLHYLTIGRSNIKKDDKNRIVAIDDIIVLLTPTEYRALMALMENPLLDDTTLVHTVLLSEYIDKRALKNLEKHIENIKGKLGFTPLSIRRVQRYGYALVIDPLSP